MARRWQWTILVCFLLSGSAGLIYEVVWSRLLGLLYGNTVLAVSTVLAAFMAGLALGSALLGRYADRHSQPLRLYALIEWCIGAYALLLPLLFGGLPVLAPLLGHPLPRFLIIFLLLLPPTVGMGGTLPILSAVFRHGQIASQVGRLYAWNTFGAVAGVALAGFVLLPHLGMRYTTLVAVAVNAVAGGIALGVSRRLPQPARVHPPPTTAGPCNPDNPPSAIRHPHVLGAFALSGAVAMLYEVAWTRGLTLVLGSSTYAFSIMLVAFLSGLALGSALMSRVIDRLRHPWLTLVLCQAGIGLTGLGGLYLFGQLPALFLGLFALLGTSYTWLLLGKLMLAVSVM
ncbi:MAG: fused MFS/spermidine synthase, partial [Candidatus Tectomicrobia bacterium]